jgi:methyl halide transferase
LLLEIQPSIAANSLNHYLKMTTTDQQDARARLLAHFSATDPSKHGQKWDELYKEDFLPWDKGFPNPALVDLLTDREDLLPRPQQGKKLKALVPGCGKGYDVLLLSAFGYDAYGLDTSNTALDAARTTERQMDGKGIYETRSGVEKGGITYVLYISGPSSARIAESYLEILLFRVRLS